MPGNSFPTRARTTTIVSSIKKVKVLVTQLCSTLWSLMDCSPPGSSVSMKFSRQEYWIGQPFPSPDHLPNPGIEPRSPALQAESLPAPSIKYPPNFVTSNKNIFFLHSVCESGICLGPLTLSFSQAAVLCSNWHGCWHDSEPYRLLDWGLNSLWPIDWGIHGFLDSEQDSLLRKWTAIIMTVFCWLE